MYLQPLPFAQELVDVLKSRGYDVVCITSRGEDTGIAIAKEALWDHFHIYPGNVFSSKTKVEILKADGMFRAHLDDNWKYAMNIGLAWEGESGKTSFLVDRPWNRGLDLDVPYKRVRSYAEVLDELK